MKLFLNKHKFILVIIVYIIIVLPAVYFGVRYLTQKINDTSDRIQEKLIDNQIENSRLENIPQMEEAANNLSKHKDALDVILSEALEVDFIKSLELLGDETNNKVKLVVDDSGTADSGAIKPKPKSKEEDKGIKERLAYNKFLSLEITLEGNYQSLIDFMHKLETGKYYVNIISVDSQKIVPDAERVVNSDRDIFSSTSSQNAAAKENRKTILKTILKVVVYLD